MALVMFDYDGVIVDSLELCSSLFINTCREHGYFDLKTREDFVQLFDGNFYESLLARGMDTDILEQILKTYDIRQHQLLNTVQLFDGIKDVLEEIAAVHQIFIITSNLSVPTLEVLKVNGINCVEDVIGADQEKSKIKKIQRVTAHFPNARSFYVGDTKGDMVEGKKADTNTIGVLWGWHSRKKLKEGTPDYLVESPLELANLLVSDLNIG